jgi:hypothetical protein
MRDQPAYGGHRPPIAKTPADDEPDEEAEQDVEAGLVLEGAAHQANQPRSQRPKRSARPIIQDAVSSRTNRLAST